MPTWSWSHFVSVFEMTIRALGGLISAHDLSGDARLLKLAVRVADRLLPAFSGATGGLPSAQLNMRTGARQGHSWARGLILAEVGSVQVEFARLFDLTNEPRYEAAARSMELLLGRYQSTHGLYGRFLPGSELALNGGCDSFYEYLLKLYLLTGRSNERLLQAYLKAVNGTKALLVRRAGELMYVGESKGGGEPSGLMEHLACYAPGMLALGLITRVVPPPLVPLHSQLGSELAYTCWRLYADSDTGLAPDTVVFQGTAKGYTVSNPKYSLRPETVETLFYMWRLTHDQKCMARGYPNPGVGCSWCMSIQGIAYNRSAPCLQIAIKGGPSSSRFESTAAQRRATQRSAACAARARKRTACPRSGSQRRSSIYSSFSRATTSCLWTRGYLIPRHIRSARAPRARTHITGTLNV